MLHSAANVGETPETWDWSKIEESTGRRGTTWRFCPASSQWRNGLAEARVKAMKNGLDLMMPAGAEALSYSEFVTVIRKVTNSINDRPLGVKKSGSKSDGEYLPISPNTLLFGRTSSQQNSLIDIEDEDKLTRRTKFVEEVEREWWKLWFCQVWDTMFPRNKWKSPHENLKTGDICLKGYPQRIFSNSRKESIRDLSSWRNLSRRRESR